MQFGPEPLKDVRIVLTHTGTVGLGLNHGLEFLVLVSSAVVLGRGLVYITDCHRHRCVELLLTTI